jgi:preprotein translocase subunit SecF
MRLFKNVNINFIKKRKIAFIISLALILIGIVSIAIHGGLRYGIDFSGGTLFELDFTPADLSLESIEIQELRDCLASNGYGDSKIQNFGDPHHVLIKIIASEDVQKDQLEIVRIIQENFPEFTSYKEVNELVRRS